ncbi:glycine cleavage system aminomethyltransferase T [Halogeometricum pallidum JCM 14848]|uniref:Probable aminomethyltransferase n=1 Tax=Halogeometricum pallidum JCM 14848 TaxID=1227487 RepID=M0DII3_HALPD|nr:glycine cleavage system aminomethyltransferase GcvT [Halogeometricum pallidum]ELZ35316.1 glycine cleavage system aminomethyltransferase T [Halogeometricum pallidum JCM 14848]
MALRKPPLREAHAARDAKFTEFGGWDMPVEFDSIRTEHAAVRESVGIFDVSHMGEVEVSGPDATTLMQRLTTNDVTRLNPGDSQYAMITNEEGTILDDTVVYRLPDEAGERYLFIPNAGHDAQMHERWTVHRDEWGLDAQVNDVTEEWAMFAVQGPDAGDAVAAASDGDAADLPKFEAHYADVVGARSWVARTGYTGEDGFEILCPWDDVETVWNAFVDDHDCTPCGLGARDTLRIEMGFLLSGQDFDPETEPRDPYEAGVGFTVKLDTEFVGRDALEAVYEEGVDEKFVGLKLLDRGVARHGYDVVDDDGHVVGHVTSGTMSPTLNEPIALGYVPVEHAEPGTRLRVAVREQEKRAKVVSTPFLED